MTEHQTAPVQDGLYRPPMPEPKYATPRNPARRTIGPRQALIAAGIGKPFMPWQRYVADVAGELDDDGGLFYEMVIVTVPRQSGKTTLYGPVQIDRCSYNPDAKTFYTAQTGKDARSRFSDLVKLVLRSPLAALVKIRYSAGDEGIIFPNGSALKIFAPTESAIHGETPPLVGFDEFWEYDEPLGDAMLEDAVMPAQITLTGNRQIWLFSTAGTALSTFMKKWVDRGRKAAQGGTEYPRLAYFEWGLPDGADPMKPENWGFHPALGWTITLADLKQASKNTTIGKWLRSFCNIWTASENLVMPLDDFDKLTQEPKRVPRRSEIAVTYEVAPDAESATVMAGWFDIDDAPCIRVLHTAPGTQWLEEFMIDIIDNWKPAAVGADDGGPTRVITDALRRHYDDEAGERIQTIGARDFGTACEALLRYARDDKTLKQDGSKTLRRDLANLVLRRFGDLTRFSRSDSTGPVAGLIAGAVALWLHSHQAQPLGKPRTKF